GMRVPRRAAAVLLLMLVATPVQRADAPAPVPPPPLAEAGLPALPAQSARNASYTIEARLDEQAHQIEGEEVLAWRNVTGAPQQTFPFHLYWNAFRNNLSTSAHRSARRAAPTASGEA